MSNDLSVFRGYNPSTLGRRCGTFQLKSPFLPAGDQEAAIAALVQGLENGERNQVLMGVTGSGKTFTMANVIQQVQRTTLILAPNKTLAAQLYGEMKEFFPKNAVEYFVSYYDYYRPEAYMPSSNTYIEKEATINEQIERMRHSATRALLEREDVIVVASVSCIYGLGEVESYQGLALPVTRGQTIPLMGFLRQLSDLQYRRNDTEFKRGVFRVRGDKIDIFPAHYEDRAWSFSFFGSEIETIHEIDALTGHRIAALDTVTVYPNNHFVTPGPTVQQAIVGIRKELIQREEELLAEGRLIEAQRLRERVGCDLETLIATGICPGIENYSCYLTGRPFGNPPPTLFEYLPANALLIADESHVAIPQLRGMYLADKTRKNTLAHYGFRLPSCCNNRPLMFQEWDAQRPLTLFVSATPGPWELEQSHSVVEQIIRPTGLLDPEYTIHPSEGQIDHLRSEITKAIKADGRTLVTTLTKRMAENLSEYFIEGGFKARYMHADIDTLARIELIADLRKGVFDILVGINLLREGLDIPECQLVAILDADKEGYLRSRTSLIQTMGRAARHINGHVILYADKITKSMALALDETTRRRQIQWEHNLKQGITPRSVKSPVLQVEQGENFVDMWANLSDLELYQAMITAASNMAFEQAGAIKRALGHRGWTAENIALGTAPSLLDPSL
jgi:excinuclease ABC subunit B